MTFGWPAPVASSSNTSSLASPAPSGLPIDLRAGLTALGDPDEMWTNADPLLAAAAGEVLATRVPLTLGPDTTAGQNRAVVARSPQSRRALMDLIADDAVRSQVAAINLRTKSVLLLIGVAAVDRVEQVSLHELVAKFENKTFVQLRIATSGATPTTATVIAVDRLPVLPTSARLVDPAMQWGAISGAR